MGGRGVVGRWGNVGVETKGCGPGWGKGQTCGIADEAETYTLSGSSMYRYFERGKCGVRGQVGRGKGEVGRDQVGEGGSGEVGRGEA